jgi:ABC-type sugar transport system ATPase subunit
MRARSCWRASRCGSPRRKYNELAASVGFALDGGANAGSLRTADKQKVEILRALCRNAHLIVMDEPTAALSRPGVILLLAVGGDAWSRLRTD